MAECEKQLPTEEARERAREEAEAQETRVPGDTVTKGAWQEEATVGTYTPMRLSRVTTVASSSSDHLGKFHRTGPLNLNIQEPLGAAGIRTPGGRAISGPTRAPFSPM